MPGADTEAQFKFLLSCIKHSVAGKVNFDAVASECEIVSKAAAAKRYERLLKAHDINPTPATPKKAAAEGAGAAKTPGSRKRKAAAKAEPKDDDDESVKSESSEEKKPAIKREKRVKKEVKTEVKTEKIEPEIVAATYEESDEGAI